MATHAKDEKVTVKIADLKIESTIVTNDDGIAEFNFYPEDLERWEPENPHLYNVELSTSDDEIFRKNWF